jgi:hypothetical protein
MTPEVGEDDIRAAALQYVRKISGFRAPAAHNREAFDEAVEAVTEATRRLLDTLEVRGASTVHPHTHPHNSHDAHSHDVENALAAPTSP